MINITVFAEDLAFHQWLDASTETANRRGFITFVFGLKKHEREDDSVNFVKHSKFIILRKRNFTLVNTNKDFNLNLHVGMGVYATLLHPVL